MGKRECESSKSEMKDCASEVEKGSFEREKRVKADEEVM